jgi:hypothetical protein
MKTKLTLTIGLASSLLLLALAAPAPANAQIIYQNDFSSLTDAGWTHDSMLVLSSGQTWSAATGAYRMTAPPNGGAFITGYGSLGYVGSYVTSVPTFTDGTVQADMRYSGPGGFGLSSRTTGLGIPLGLNGYSLYYEPWDTKIRLQQITGGGGTGIGSTVTTTLAPGTTYTFVLTTLGSFINGQVWQGGIGGTLIANISGIDGTWTSGYIGAWGLSAFILGGNTDFTMDNFVARVPEPGTGLMLVLGLGGLLVVRARRSK